jgi:hypothetical protein
MYYYNVDPREFTDDEWAEKFKQLNIIRKKEAGN